MQKNDKIVKDCKVDFKVNNKKELLNCLNQFLRLKFCLPIVLDQFIETRPKYAILAQFIQSECSADIKKVEMFFGYPN